MLPHARLSPLLVILMAIFFGGSAGQGEGQNCEPGYYDNGLDCYACSQGTYKSSVGPGPCVPCGMDGDGRRATTRGSAATDPTHCYYKPYIVDFHPKKGPVAGGTLVNVSIGYFAEREIFLVKIARIEVNKTTVTIGKTWMAFLTPASDSVKKGTILSDLIDSVTEYRIESAEEFSYEINPIVSYIENLNRGTILSGGITMVVRGSGLNVVRVPYMIITRVYRRDVTVFKSPCTVLDDTTMTCLTPDLTQGLDISAFQLTPTKPPPNPDDSSLPSKLPEGTHNIGGKTVNCTLVDTTNTTTYPNGTTITRTVTTVRGPRECESLLNNSVSGDSEDRNARRKRDTKDTEDNSEPINNNELQFYIGFQFDGVDTYENFTSLPVFQDPEYHKFEDDDYIRFFDSKKPFLHIRGERLTQGVSVHDVRVHVGAGVCNVTTLATNRLICRPPLQHPGHAAVRGPDDAVLVEVQVGYLNYFIGYLQYSPDESDSNRLDYFIIIIVACSVFFISIVVIWMAVTFGCKASKARRREKAGRLIKSVSAESSLTTNSTDNSGSTASGGLDNVTVIPMHDIFDSLDADLKEKVRDCQLPSDKLRLGDVIGAGSFGVVYKGQLSKEKCDVVVAVKTLRDLNANERDISIFLEEALAMKGFRHPNILPLHGVVFKEYVPLVVFEFMDKGDLKSYVLKNKLTQDFQTGDLLGFGLQVVEGMSYLSKQGFIHRDLAARNCLINTDEVVKIGDFGLSRDLHGQDYYRVGERQRPLPVKWMSVESLNLGKFTSKSDVWSFGVLLWELLSKGSSPYADVDNADLKDFINQGHRLCKPKDTPDHVYKLMKSCWMKNPRHRPGFDTLTVKLRDIVEKNGFARKGAIESSYVELH